MPAFARRARRTVDIWPGWVDALSTLLIIIIFVLLVFVLGQFFLSVALTGRDKQIGDLGSQISEISRMLSLEKQARAALEENLGRITAELTESKEKVDALSQVQIELTGKLAEKTTEANSRAAENANLTKTVNAAKEQSTLDQIGRAHV